MKSAERVRQRPGEEAINSFVEIETGCRTNDNAENAPQETLPELLEVLEERHLLAVELLILIAGRRRRRGRVLNDGRHTWEPPVPRPDRRSGPPGGGPGSLFRLPANS